MRARTGWLKEVFNRIKRSRHWIGISASIILGLIFIISGIGKFFNQSVFLDTLLAD